MTTPTPHSPTPTPTPGKPHKLTEVDQSSTSGKRTDTESGVDTGAIEPGRSGQNGAFAG